MTEQQLKTANLAIEIAKAVVEAVKAAGSDGLPSGQLYATMMTGGMTLATYEKLIAMLLRSRIVSEKNHVLRYCA